MSAVSSAVEAAITGPKLVSALLTVEQQLDLVITCWEEEVLWRGFSHRQRPWSVHERSEITRVGFYAFLLTLFKTSERESYADIGDTQKKWFNPSMQHSLIL